jgi:hypothetical protein
MEKTSSHHHGTDEIGKGPAFHSFKVFSGVGVFWIGRLGASTTPKCWFCQQVSSRGTLPLSCLDWGELEYNPREIELK